MAAFGPNSDDISVLALIGRRAGKYFCASEAFGINSDVEARTNCDEYVILKRTQDTED